MIRRFDAGEMPCLIPLPARFVFSCDAHVAEPPDLFAKAMPEHLQQFAIRSESDGDLRITKIGEQVILKIQTNFHQHKTGEGDAAFNAQTGTDADRSCTVC